MALFGGKNEELIMKEISALKAGQMQCFTKHGEHEKRFSQHIEIQNSQDSTLKEILNQLKVFNENFLPVIIRTRNDQITRDTMKAGALWITAVLGSVSAIAAIFHFTA